MGPASLNKKVDFFNKKNIILLIAVLIVLGIGYKIYTSGQAKPNQLKFEEPKVMVSEAVMGPVVQYINAVGTLRPYDSVIIKSEVDARIDKISFSEGAMVSKDDVLIELDKSKAYASLKEAEAQYRKAMSEFEPMDKLANKGVVPKITRDTKKAELDMCAARVALYKSVLEKHTIKAPFGGVVGLKEISSGEFVTPGKELVKIVDCHPLKVDFKVPEISVSHVYVGQKIKVLVGEASDEYDAVIIAIDPESDKITHSFDIRAILDVPEETALNSKILKPGIYVKVRIACDEYQQGVLIPESAIEKIGDEDTVFRVVEGRAVRTLITSGIRRDGNVEIITGLNEGDMVVTSGQQNVLDGREVSILNNFSTSDVVKALSEQAKHQAVAKILKK